MALNAYSAKHYYTKCTKLLKTKQKTVQYYNTNTAFKNVQCLWSQIHDHVLDCLWSLHWHSQ